MTIWTILITFAGIVSVPALAIAYIPQIIQIAKTKTVEGINLGFWYILDLSLLCFVILALDGFLKTGAWSLLFAQCLNLALALVVTVQVLYYRKK